MEIPTHPKCSKCEHELAKLKEFMENRPWKYGCRAKIEIRQDFMGTGWHLDNVQFDNYEAESLRKECEKATSEGRDYNLQEFLDNLSWYDRYHDEYVSPLTIQEEE